MIEDQLLHVQINPGARLEEFLHLFKEVRQLADEHQVKNILIDARTFNNKVSAVQCLQLAMALVGHFLGCRVAGVISPESFDPHLLTETMARNRGGKVKMTTSLPEALQWLGVRVASGRFPLADGARALVSGSSP